MKRCDKSSPWAENHVGPLSYYGVDTATEGTTCVGTCANCGNTVMLRLLPGQPQPKLGAHVPIHAPPQKD